MTELKLNIVEPLMNSGKAKPHTRVVEDILFLAKEDIN